MTPALIAIALLAVGLFGCAPHPAGTQAPARETPRISFAVIGAVITPSLENFTRVEGFGTPYHHWLQITIEPNEPNVFTFPPRIVAASLTPQR